MTGVIFVMGRAIEIGLGVFLALSAVVSAGYGIVELVKKARGIDD